MKGGNSLSQIRIQSSEDIDHIVDLYSDTVYRVAYSQTKDKSHTDDVFQEVFLRLIKKSPTFESQDHLKAWLIRVTINCSKNIFLSSHFKRRATLDDTLVDEYQVFEKSDLYYAVMDLPKKYRAVIHLHYYEGYKIKEIASIMNQKETTIKTHLFRARKILEDKLKGGLKFE